MFIESCNGHLVRHEDQQVSYVSTCEHLWLRMICKC
jgi:hypothetical protein